MTKISLLEKIYEYLDRNSKGKIDMFTINQLTNMPLIVCQKLVGVMNEKERHFLTKEQFIEGFYKLYYGEEEDKIFTISKMCDFKSKNIIKKEDVLILLYHFHYRFMNSLKENLLVKVVNNFFGEDEQMYLDEFMNKCSHKNYDLMAIFKAFFDKVRFIQEEHCKIFEILKESTKYIIVDSPNSRKFGSIIENKLSFDQKSDYHKAPSNKELDETEFLNITGVEKNLGYVNNISNISSMKRAGSIKSINNNKSLKPSTHFQVPITNKNIIFGFEISEVNKIGKTSKLAKTYLESVKNADFEILSYDDDEDMRLTLTSFDNDYQDIVSSLMNEKKYTKAETIKISSDMLDNYNFEIDDERKFLTKKTFKKPKNNLLGNIFDQPAENKQNQYIHSAFTKKMEIKKFSIQSLVCYKLDKKQTKVKKVKFVYYSNLIYYFTWIENGQKFMLKKIIPIFQLYLTKEQASPRKKKLFFPSSLKDEDFYCLEITSAVRGKVIERKFFSRSIGSLNKFQAHIEKVENIRDIDNIYIGDEMIGEGGFGRVLRGNHILSGELIAIKEINKNLKTNQDVAFQCAQWEKDVFIFLSHLKPNNIINCYDFFETHDKIYYVQEYLSGGDLKKFVSDNMSKKNGPLYDQKKLDDITIQILRGLAIFHKYGIMHRDIKHTNILLKPKGENFIAKIIDFGLSKTIGKSEFAMENYGSLMFKSPEFFLKKYYNFSIDLWALGITVFYLYSKGKYPSLEGRKEALIEQIKTANFNLDYQVEYFGFSHFACDIIKKSLVVEPLARADVWYFLNKYDKNHSQDDFFS